MKNLTRWWWGVSDYLSTLRRMGRSAVLPVDTIKAACKNGINANKITSVLDFGAGTLLWANWFATEFGCDVYAVDVYYKDTAVARGKIRLYSQLDACLSDVDSFSLAWVCDVLHHLSKAERDAFLAKVIGKTDVIIIKDIDMRHAFGNFMNRVHDRLINGEVINDVNPIELERYFQSFGFTAEYLYMPKLWYPHFMLIAKKKLSYI
jgi:hypothetical protein